MLTKQGSDPDVADKQQGPERLNALIGKWVLHTLGQPANLHQVQVRLLWEHHYRVNILVGTNAAMIRVAHSFFLEANSEGDIVGSTPTITKQY